MYAFFVIKEKSERVKNKNFKKFSNIFLYKKALLNFKDFKVFVDTDSKKIINQVKKDKKLSHVHCYMREKKLIDMEKSLHSPGPFMIKNFLENYVKGKNDIVVTSHVTNPFLKIKTLKKAIRKMKFFDSVSSCHKVKNFSYLEGRTAKPINFNPKVQQKTQNLKSIIVTNGAFFIIKKNIFLNNGLKRISNNNLFYYLDFPEYLEIDNYEDLKLALLIEKHKIY